GAVLSDEKRYGCFKPQLGEMANGGDGVGIVLRRGAEHALAGNGLDEDVGNRGRQLGTVFLHLSSATGLISATLGGVILCYLEKHPTRQVDYHLTATTNPGASRRGPTLKHDRPDQMSAPMTPPTTHPADPPST